ncbi:MAG: hypothetical protein H6933_00160 [Burkholderiaceae bacterium]|nr:hypothetical protein [Burkholderiaceae bacterium]
MPQEPVQRSPRPADPREGLSKSSDPRARPPKPAEWRRWVGILLRTGHLAGVVWLGAALLGAPVGPGGGWLTLISGSGLFASELLDRRVALTELAGVVVLAKLAVVAAMLCWPAVALWLFWPLLVISGVSAHAPKPLRHWRPGR